MQNVLKKHAWAEQETQHKSAGYTAIQDIRAKCAWVSARARHVRINHDKIAGYTAGILQKYPLITTMDMAHHYPSAEYVLALDSVNFGSGYFDIARQAGIELEYEMIARGLKNAFLLDEMNTPAKWRAATPAMCHDVFGIPAVRHPALDTLVAQFAHHLNVTGEMIGGFYGDNVANLLEEAGGSAVRLARAVAAWPTFHDVAVYDGEKVPVFKRAQIFAADIFLTLEGRGMAAFDDMDQLTIFADNMVPHVLRHDGILSYDADLSARIDAGEMILAGSAEETEIRCVAIHAVELMRQSVSGVTSVNLDHLLWHRGYEPEIYKLPTHKTLSVWY
jgi:hypothetical protein